MFLLLQGIKQSGSRFVRHLNLQFSNIRFPRVIYWCKECNLLVYITHSTYMLEMVVSESAPFHRLAEPATALNDMLNGRE